MCGGGGGGGEENNEIPSILSCFDPVTQVSPACALLTVSLLQFQHLTYVYSLEHGWIENVHSSIDLVRHIFLRFFHKLLYLTIFYIVDNNTIF